jgi:RNA polymerase sigma-70 factor (ECF subfamily)
MIDIEQILIRAKAGDKDAFGLIYNEYYVPIFRYVHTRIRSKEQAEDLTQDIFLKIYRNIASISSSEASPLGYFYTTARNTLIDFWRKKNLQVESDDDFLGQVPDPTPSQLDTAKLKEQSSIVSKCLAELSLDQREVLTLRFVEDKTTREISEMLGKKETAIRQLQVRGLRTLRKLFNQTYGTE